MRSFNFWMNSWDWSFVVSLSQLQLPTTIIRQLAEIWPLIQFICLRSEWKERHSSSSSSLVFVSGLDWEIRLFSFSHSIRFVISNFKALIKPYNLIELLWLLIQFMHCSQLFKMHKQIELTRSLSYLTLSFCAGLLYYGSKNRKCIHSSAVDNPFENRSILPLLCLNGAN